MTNYLNYIFLGIANTLDLTRILPRLEAQHHCKPHSVHFAPYTQEQIYKVLKDRLQQVFSTLKNIYFYY